MKKIIIKGYAFGSADGKAIYQGPHADGPILIFPTEEIAQKNRLTLLGLLEPDAKIFPVEIKPLKPNA